ncbi:MAG TPA: DUF1499 domain-containing protein [Burkholderiales bacterium]|nr:DUF1499 domain-containing protein [Burkholderiales bacterium]
MTDAQVASLKNRIWPLYGAYLGLGLALVALALLAISPLGWHAGWWHFRFAFFWLMPFSGYIALAAGVVCAIALGVGQSGLGGRGIAMAGTGIVLSLALAYVPWQYSQTLKSVPRIHDITTDTGNPPAFVAALPARAAEKANSVAYEGPELAKQQKAAYPDIVPLKVALPPNEAFKRALDAATGMPGWAVVYSDPATGRIEANETSRWFRFVDDVVIRVAADGAGSRIDIRSESRQGRSDFGVNARRIRAYMEVLKAHVA